jgi:type I restriction enzyme M protein
VVDFEKQMRLKIHYVVKPDHLWANIANLARNECGDLLDTLGPHGIGKTPGVT